MESDFRNGREGLGLPEIPAPVLRCCLGESALYRVQSGQDHGREAIATCRCLRPPHLADLGLSQTSSLVHGESYGEVSLRSAISTSGSKSASTLDVFLLHVRY